ncbi:metal-sulfur cluster assembly factor [Porticoccaceae bacterium nBUS_17]
MAILKQDVIDSMRDVMDPHMNVNLNDMGMIGGVTINADGDIEVGLVFPCIGCPAMDLIKDDAEKAVRKIAGARNVTVKADWGKKWDRTMLSQEARDNAKSHGYII